MNQPIGIFDSGVGGISVWKEVAGLLPNESIIYLADSINCPYGSRSREEIIQLSEQNVEFLLSQHCKTIIVACNTATAAAIDFLRSKYPMQFIGMEPAVKPAAINSSTRNIGILATEGTFNGKLFLETSSKFAKGINLHMQVGYGLVEYIESGDLENTELDKLLNSYLKPMIKNEVDNIVLGCTHYPFLIGKIENIVGKKVKIINPAPAIANRTKFILEKFNISANKINKPYYKFYTTGSLEIISKFLSSIEKSYNLEYLDPKSIKSVRL